MDSRKLQVLIGAFVFVVGLAVFVGMCARRAEAAEGRATTVAAPDGTPIHYVAWGRGEPTLVFIHCWSCDSGYWHDQIKPFAATHRVVTVDLAGHGDSGQERTDYTVEAFGRDVVAVLEAEGIEDAVLVGHSMGGPVAVEAALAAPERVRGVIGIDNFQDLHVKLSDEQIAGFTGMMRADFAGTVAPWVRTMFAAGADSALVDRIAADMAAGPPAVGLSAMGNLLHWFNVAGERVARLGVGLTTVSGDLRPTDAEGNRTFAPGFKVRVVPGTGHFPMLEKPGAFNAELAAAIAEFAGNGSAGQKTD